MKETPMKMQTNQTTKKITKDKILNKINRNKVWQINNSEELVSDKELKRMIQSGKLKGNDLISSNALPNPTKIEDSIYCIYIKSK